MVCSFGHFFPSLLSFLNLQFRFRLFVFGLHPNIILGWGAKQQTRHQVSIMPMGSKPRPQVTFLGEKNISEFKV